MKQIQITQTIEITDEMLDWALNNDVKINWLQKPILGKRGQLRYKKCISSIESMDSEALTAFILRFGL